MSEGKTIGQLMEEMRAKAGAQNYHGHGYMDLQRFAEDTRHMIIFDVLTNDSPVGWKGERTRLFLSDTGYEKALDSQYILPIIAQMFRFFLYFFSLLLYNTVYQIRRILLP